MTNKFNKLTLFLSTLAIALVALLIMHFKGMTLMKQVSASGIDNSEAISEIYDYIESLNGFTDEQKAELHSLIQEQIDNNNELTEEELLNLYQLVDQKHQSNVTNLENIKKELQLKLYSIDASDNGRYKELISLIDEIDVIIAEMKKQNGSSIQNIDAKISDLQDAIDKLNKRTTDNNGSNEFNFGYKDGTYGYYIDGNNFRPF